jgi:hypothetical protein
MSEEFSMEITWQPGTHGLKEDRLTSALLNISFPEGVATRANDSWSATVLDNVRVSGYPLALWLASSWWRLRWEPGIALKGTDWRMAHDLRAAGHGFIWPPLSFEADGENIDAICSASDPRSREPVRYISSFKSTVSAVEFEQTVDSFIGRVVSRLTEMGMPDTDLHHLWQEVLEERWDRGKAAFRKLEAQLGFDPDESPEKVLKELMDLASEAGEAAIAEIAPALHKGDLAISLARTIELAQSPGIDGRISPDRGFVSTHRHDYEAAMPWERGRLLARDARAAWSLADAVSDKQLSDILDIRLGEIANGQGTRGPIGLAVRQEGSDRLALHFRRTHRHARRFESARFIADDLLTQADKWLPATDTSTARQKMQRAFAAEFLCPIGSLKDYLQEDYFNDELIEDAAEYFSVSPLMIKSHLANHDLLPSYAVAVH